MAADADAIGRVMWDAIHNGRSAYTPAERAAWLANPNSGDAWAARLAAQLVWVAEADAQVQGVLTLGANGYIDLAYVRAAFQGREVFRRLYQALEETAHAQGTPRLWTHASLMAQPAFATQGFHVIRHETVERSGQHLARAEMEKRL